MEAADVQKQRETTVINSSISNWNKLSGLFDPSLDLVSREHIHYSPLLALLCKETIQPWHSNIFNNLNMRFKVFSNNDFWQIIYVINASQESKVIIKKSLRTYTWNSLKKKTGLSHYFWGQFCVKWGHQYGYECTVCSAVSLFQMFPITPAQSLLFFIA